MDMHFHSLSGGDWRAECALLFCCAGDEPDTVVPALLDQQPWIAISPALRDFTGKKDEQTLLHGHADLAIPRVLLAGLGKPEKVTLDTFRLAVAKAVQLCRQKGFARLGLPVESLTPLAQKMGSTVEALLKEATIAAQLCLYRSTTFKSAALQKDETKDPVRFTLFFNAKETPDAAHKAVREGEAEAAGILLARALVNAPANIMTPASLAQNAQDLAKRHGFSCRVMEKDDIIHEGMGALWAVGKGSTLPPCFIILEACPKGKEKDNPLVLVGKGITFDTGGISLKPPANMHEMKGDMGGAAAVLGFFEALGALPDAETLPRVVGLIPVAENMPGGNATRPGDIVTTLSGKTVEILNTDAEGRLILCDALTYAQKNWKPAAVVNIATLTGACVVALGDLGAGMFTKDRVLRSVLFDAADTTGDLLWPLPLWDCYDNDLESDVADMPNLGKREGGALYAALFLQRFIEEGTRWVHLDVAGPAYVVKKTPLHPVAGGTGCGVRLFCELARNFV